MTEPTHFDVWHLARWLLLLPAAILTWHAALFFGIAAVEGLNLLCPANKMVSGMCLAPWYDGAVQALTCAFAALSAALILLVSIWIAPSHKRHVAIVVFIAGVFAATFLGFAAQEYLVLAATIVTATFVLWMLLRPRADQGGAQLDG